MNPSEKFLQLNLKVAKDSSDIVSEFLLKSGAISSAETLYHENFTHNLDNDYTWLQFAFHEDFPVQAVLIMSMELLKITEYEYNIHTINTEDILNEMKKNMTAFSIGKSFMLYPSYENAVNQKEIDKDKNILIINPAFAFGTGQHETSRIMLDYIENTVKPHDTVVDLGCGSGILSIASTILGADSVTGIDIEDLSVKASQENKALNKEFYDLSKINKNWQNLHFVQDDFSWYKKAKPKAIDLFLANILPGVFQKNEEETIWYLSNSKKWALSGIYGHALDNFLPWLKSRIKNKDVHTREKDGWYIIYSAIH